MGFSRQHSPPKRDISGRSSRPSRKQADDGLALAREEFDDHPEQASKSETETVSDLFDAAFAELMGKWPALTIEARCEGIRELMGASFLGILRADREGVIRHAVSSPPSHDSAECALESIRKKVRNPEYSQESSGPDGVWLDWTSECDPFEQAYLILERSSRTGQNIAFFAAFEQPPEHPHATSLIRTGGYLLVGKFREEGLERERKTLETMMRQSQRLASIGRLASGVAHDFNNLLTVIQGNLNLIRPGISKTSQHRVLDSLETIQSAADRAVELTRQLLFFGRRQEIEFTRCNLNEVIRNFGRMMRRMIEENIDLRFDLDPNIGHVKADTGMLCQIFMNLLVNARDAMKNGGRITIGTKDRVMETAEGKIEPGHYVIVSIADEGSGISKDYLSRIFDPFFSTKGPGKGTGLGLANVADLVRQHEGFIDVSTREGEGTRFDLFFPVLEEEIENSPTTRVAEPKAESVEKPPKDSKSSRMAGGEGIRGTRVLLVEDETSVRRLVRKLLEMLGCEVVESSSGRDALERWPKLSEEISMVVTDVMMPGGVSGWDLAKSLHETNPELGILLTSGYNERPEDHGLGDVPEIAFLQKPYDANSLRDGIQSLLKKA